MRVDAHQHYWKLERGDYGWLTPNLKKLYRDYLPADLLATLQAQRIDKTIVVQAAPTVAETEYLLELCEQEETLVGVVGWLDLDASDFSQHYTRLRNNPYFIGLRPMLQDIADDMYILRPRVMRSLQQLAEDQFPLDLLVHPRHLPHVITMLEQVPGIRAVVDHLAKPNIAEGILDPWRSDIAQIAQYPNVYCKLSGMVTEAQHERWTATDFIPYVQHILSIFGSKRTMFGSDWPVCLLAARDYGQVIHLLEDVLPEDLTALDRDNIFGLNALEFYKIIL